MADLFEGYGDPRVFPGTATPYDEMFASAATPRGPYEMVHEALSRMSRDELRGRTDALASSYLAQGVTFDFAGEERPFPLDAVPRVISQGEWAGLEAGIQQRVRALEAFLADIYGAKSAIRDRVIPASVITSSEHFLRAAHNVVAA
ncbi:MAG: circularly permuted type 2 ATP-grasp protein, partial [Pontimonas sp.]|nr:circularly permuted type 2 ATP-grasp protein [Pontimonas sp.]